MVYLTVTYDQDFDDLIMHLRAKYPKELLNVDGLGNQLDMNKFSKSFFSTKVTADASIDGNANVADSTVISYHHELPKPFFKLNSYYMLWKGLKKLYGQEVANNIIEMQISGDIYINDVHGIGGRLPYCFAFSTYDVAINGLPMIEKIHSIAPKHFYSFKSQIEQYTIIAANSILGASAIPDFLCIASWYIEKILKNKADASFNFATEEDCWKYIKETFVSFIYTINQPSRGNQCFDDSTELLTPTGFKKYNELKEGDLTYTWNNGKLNIQPIKKMNVYDHDGEMHHYTGRDLDMLITPNHRVLHYKNNSHDTKISLSTDLYNKKTPLRIPVSMRENDTADYNISDDMLKLYTFILTDGHIKLGYNGRRNIIRIYKSPKRWGNDELINILNSNNIKYTIRERPDGWDNGGSIFIYSLSADDSEEICKNLNNTKAIIPDWFLQLSSRQANLVIDTWAKLDGYTNKNAYGSQKLQCDNHNIANSIQQLCFIAQRGSCKTERYIGNNKQPTLYVIPYIRNKKSVNNCKKINYKGKVWCPTTDDGIVVVRRNGKVFISGNSCFTNISIYDDYFLDNMLKDYVFPDGTTPKKEIVKQVQNVFLDIMNKEMERTPVTFPVMTACFSVDEERNIKDVNFLKSIVEKNEKFGFINIFCGKSSTLSSCCRLRSDTNSEYFNSLGAGSSKIGSLGVVTINLPRLAYKYKDNIDKFFDELRGHVTTCSRINNVKRRLIQEAIDNGYHPLYSLNFMDITKQYSTVGINGFNECIEILGDDILTESGTKLGLDIIETINKENDRCQTQYKTPHNCEQIPGESASIKLAKKDKIMNYNKDEYTLYSNQFIPLTTRADMLDRIKLQGIFDKHFSGGSICHINLETCITQTRMSDLIITCAKKGVIYFSLNYNIQECEDGHMSVGNKKTCDVCGKKIINNYQRVVGFLTNTKNWIKERREYDYPNRQFYSDI